MPIKTRNSLTIQTRTDSPFQTIQPSLVLPKRPQTAHPRDEPSTPKTPEYFSCEELENKSIKHFAKAIRKDNLPKIQQLKGHIYQIFPIPLCIFHNIITAGTTSEDRLTLYLRERRAEQEAISVRTNWHIDLSLWQIALLFDAKTILKYLFEQDNLPSKQTPCYYTQSVELNPPEIALLNEKFDEAYEALKRSKGDPIAWKLVED